VTSKVGFGAGLVVIGYLLVVLNALSLRTRAFFWIGTGLGGFQLVEQGIEALEVGLPELAILFEPLFQLLERGRAEGVDAALGVAANADEAGLAEHAEMLRNLGLAEAEAQDEFADGAGAAEQEFDDVEAIGFGEGAEGGKHGADEYASRGIVVSRNI
jgi:hypothetical protein